MLCALSVSKWQRKEQLPSLPVAELKSKTRKKEEENRWKGPSGRVRWCTARPSWPTSAIWLFIRVQRHQDYSAFDRSEHVFTSKEASGMVLWMTPWWLCKHSANSGVWEELSVSDSSNMFHQLVLLMGTVCLLTGDVCVHGLLPSKRSPTLFFSNNELEMPEIMIN